MKVRGAEDGVGAVINACGEACRDIAGPAQRNHQMREVAAHPFGRDQGVDGRGVGVRGVLCEGRAKLNPVTNGLGAAITSGQLAKLPHGQFVQPVGLTIATGIKKAKHIRRQLCHRNFFNLRRVGHMVSQLNRCAIAHLKGASASMQPHDAAAGFTVKFHRGGNVLAQVQIFLQNALLLGMGRMNIENEVATRLEHLVVQLQCETQMDHGGMP